MKRKYSIFKCKGGPSKSIIAFSQGVEVPSSRFRLYYLESHFAQNRNDSFDIDHALGSSYPPQSKIKRFGWFFCLYLSRLIGVLKSYRYDAVIIQREFISTIPTLEFLTKRPRILDVDDAIWLHRNGLAADRIAQHVDHIVCGNQYLAEYFEKFDKPITIIPTPVDISRFRPLPNKEVSKVIGWSGTSGGFRFLYSIQDALLRVLKENHGWVLRVVSDQQPCFERIPKKYIEFVQWSVENEVDSIASMDIGVMPLDDTDWSRGKCSYKMLLYMACSIPVVVSDFGMNKEVLEHGFVGYGAKTENDWYNCLTSLIASSALRLEAGRNGRSVILENYSIEQALSKWCFVISSATTSTVKK